jgi:hypothetical protein
MVKKVKFNLDKFRKPRKDQKSVKPVRKKGRPDFADRIKKLGKT